MTAQASRQNAIDALIRTAPPLTPHQAAAVVSLAEAAPRSSAGAA